MKYILLIIFTALSYTGFSQYNPALHNTSNKAYGSAQFFATDARTMFYDASNFVYRAYVDTTEVWNYLNVAKYRGGSCPILVNTGGTLVSGVITGGTNRLWYYKNGTNRNNLVPMESVTSVNGRVGDVISLNADSIRGLRVDTTFNRNGYALLFDSVGHKWYLGAAGSGSYSAGTGIDITSNIVSALNTTALWNASTIRGRSVTTSAPTVGQVLYWDGTSIIWKDTTNSGGTGSVTNVATGFGVAGGPITTIGTIRADTTSSGLSSYYVRKKDSVGVTGYWTRYNADTSIAAIYYALGNIGAGGITQLTGDGTAGPGSGSQLLTLSTVNVNVGSFTNANITVDGKGRITAAANGSAGSPNSNIGSGFRLAVPNTNNIKTLFTPYGLITDSTTNANAITTKVDTATLFPQVRATVSPIDTTSLSNRIDTNAAYINVLENTIAPVRQKIQGYVPGVYGSVDAATTMKLNDGRLLTVFQSLIDPNADNTPGQFYYTLWDGKTWSTPLQLFPDGFTGYSNHDGPSLYRLENGNIGLTFHVFASLSDNPIQFTTTANQAPPFTWSTPTTIYSDPFSRYTAMQYDVALKASDGNFYLPFSVNTNGEINNQGGNYVGRYAKSTDGNSWTVASTILTGGPDSLVSEPGFYETPENLNDPYGLGNKVLTFYWRGRSGSLQVRDSLFGGTGFDYVRTLGLKLPNSTVNVKAHNRLLYAVSNTYFSNASSQDEKRKQLDLSVSSDNGNSFQLIEHIDGNYDDSTSFHEGSMFFDDSSGHANLYLFYTSILEQSYISELFVKRYPAFYLAPKNTIDPVFSKMTISVGDIPSGSTYQNVFKINSPTAGAAYMLGFGGGGTDKRYFEPYIFSNSTPSSAIGLQFDSQIGNDVGSNWYNSTFVFNGKNGSGGNVANAFLATINNNGSLRFAFHKDGQFEALLVDSTSVPTNPATVYWDVTDNKFKRAVFSSDGYSLPTASTSVLGGVKVDGTSIVISSGVISALGGGSVANGLYNNSGTVELGYTSGGSGNGKLTHDTYVNLDGHSMVWDGGSAGDFQITAPLIIGVLGGSPDASWQMTVQKSGGNSVMGLYNNSINTRENIFHFRGLNSGGFAPDENRWIGRFEVNTISSFGMKTNGTTWAGGAVRGYDYVWEGPDASGGVAERMRVTGSGELSLSSMDSTTTATGGFIYRDFATGKLKMTASAGGGDYESRIEALEAAVEDSVPLKFDTLTLNYNNADSSIRINPNYIYQNDTTLTATAGTNVTGAGAITMIYSRQGEYVTCDGVVNLTATSSGLSNVYIPLPIASAFDGSALIFGSGSFPDAAFGSGSFTADAANDRAQLNFNMTAGLASFAITFHFVYKIQ